MSKFSRSLAGVLALLLLLVAGCGGTKTEAPKAESKKEATPAKPVELNFYYPVAVGGPITKTIEGMVEAFNKANPTIKVTPVFSGNYTETMTKVQAAIQGGTTPEVAVLLATDVFSLIDGKAIVPLDEYVAADKDGKAYLDDMLPAFMANSKLDGKTWSVPFQRSTVVLYYNKEQFKEVGLDPEKPPTSWEQLTEYAKKLTKEGRWGLEIPSDGNPSWVFSSFFIENGKNVVNEAGTEVSFNAPEVIEALSFIQGLSKSHKVMPPGVIKWADVPNDFITGKAAMVYHTTGSIASIKSKMDPAKVGVAFLPKNKKYGSPTGGGNIYILKTTPEKQAAAWKFIRFMTETERVASWSVETGYIPYRKSAAETKTFKDAVAGFAGYAVAANSLQYADREIAAHNNQQILKVLGDQLQAVVGDTKPIKDAMDQAQKDAEAILKPFKK